MQGTPNNGSGANRVLDLNALLAERRLDPVEVKLGDATYMVNTGPLSRYWSVRLLTGRRWWRRLIAP
jgi:hypothetical protein